MAEKKLVLLDAYALIFRAYYAFIRNPRVTSKGQNTSAIFGFVNTLEEVLRTQKPTHIAVVFDHRSPTVREKEFPYYKANRQETPEDIRESEPWIRDIIKAYNIPVLEAEGYEADDVIGTLAKIGSKKGFTVYMVTPDKDFGQLVDENIFMYKPGRQGKPAELIGVDEVRTRYGIERPEQVIDILALMGDSVDNIPGLPGVGEKTAMKLIGQFGSVEKLYESTEELKGKLKERVVDNKQAAFDSKKLATILLDAPVPFEPTRLILERPNAKRLSELFAALEFRALGKRVLGDEFSVTSSKSAPSGQPSLFDENVGTMEAIPDGKNIKNTDHKYHCADTAEKRNALIAELKKQQEIALDTETTGLDPHNTELVGISFSWKAHEAYFVPCMLEGMNGRAIIAEFKEVLEDASKLKIGHNIKFDMEVLRWYGVEVSGPLYDTMVAHYVGDSKIRHKLDVMSEAYLGYTPVPIGDLIGKRGRKEVTMADVELKELSEYAAEDADITWQLKPIVEKMVGEVKGGELMAKVELPLIHVLADMESEGIGLDVDFLKDFSKELTTDLIDIRDKIYGFAGAEFNLDSPKQLGPVLFETLKISYTGKKTKTGQYSTSEETLTKVRDEHEIIPLILNYRELTKLRSTYVDALPELVNPRTGRVHTTFNQTIAATGRLSSIGPNLQNIPIRTDLGRRVRKAFIPRNADYQIMSADYSQVELRIIAHITQDAGMLEAFQNKEDIHSSTAAKVFGVSIDEVDREMRRKAKAVNFGLAYGQSAFGLAQTLGIARGEAKEIIENYFEKFPGIKEYMTDTIAFCKEHGFVKTILNRRRYLRDINSRNYTVRAQAERNAINSPIQGSAADLIKLAMIDIHRFMQQEKVQSKMLLQVHDELVFDAHRNEVEMLKPVIIEKMQNAIKGLKVPIEVGLGVGENWLEAH